MAEHKANHIRWGVILTYVSLAINILVSILYTPLMLKALGQSGHGLYSTVSSTMSWLSLLGLGIGSSYIRYFAKYKVKNDDDSLASLNGLFIIIFSIIGAISLVCGLFIANNLGIIFSDGLTVSEYDTARVLAIIVTIDLSISFPASVFKSIIMSNEKFIQLKAAALFQNVCTPLITLPLILNGHGSIAIVTVTTAVDFAAHVFNMIYCFKVIRARFRFKGFERGIMKGIFGFSVFIAINMIIQQFATGLDKTIISRFLGTAAASVYAIGASLYTYFSAFSSAVSSVFAPRIHKITAKFEDDKARLKELLTEQFIKLGRIQFLIQSLMLTGIIFFGRQFIHLWAERNGSDYGNSYYIALLLCGSMFIPLIQSIGMEIQRAQNKHRFRTLFYAIMTLVNVVLTIVLCKIWGEIGAAVGTAAATLAVDVIVMNIYYNRHLYLDIPKFWFEILKMSRGVLIPVAVGVPIMLFFEMDTIPKFLIGVAAYTAVYAASMWFLALNREEKELFGGKIKSVLGKIKKEV